MTKTTNTGQINVPTSPMSKSSFPLTPTLAGAKSETPAVLLPLDLIQGTDDRSTVTAAATPVNGISSTSTPDAVTVTHFSETRGTMQKISVPSMNIFNAEFKASDANKTHQQQPSFIAQPQPPPPTPSSTSMSTNPFLNTSPVASPVTTTITPTHTTNPFHVSLNASPLQPDATIMPAHTNNISPKSNDIVSICSENNNGTIIATTLTSKVDASKKPIVPATNPFHAMDETDNEHNYHSINNSVVVVSNTKNKTNNSDALNNLRNNNCMVIERNNDTTLDNENNKNIRYIEVISDYSF